MKRSESRYRAPRRKAPRFGVLPTRVEKKKTLYRRKPKHAKRDRDAWPMCSEANPVDIGQASSPPTPRSSASSGTQSLRADVRASRLVSLLKKAALAECPSGTVVSIRSRRSGFRGFLYETGDGAPIELEALSDAELIDRAIDRKARINVFYWVGSRGDAESDDIFGEISTDPKTRDLVIHHGFGRARETRLPIDRPATRHVDSPQEQANREAAETARQVVQETVEVCMQAIRKHPDYRIPDRYAPNVYVNPTGKYRSKGGQVSMRGIKPPNGYRTGIRLHLGNYIHRQYRENPTSFQEYASIRHDPDIGDCVVRHWTDAVRVITAHEVAHAIQDEPTITRPKSLDYRNPHGEGWQDIYRCFRRALDLNGPTTNNDFEGDDALLAEASSTSNSPGGPR